MERLLDELVTNQTATTPNGSGDRETLERGAQRMRVTLIFFLVGFATIWLLCVGLIWHMRINRAGALKGDTVAARKVVLPAYEPVLIVLGVINGVYIIYLVVTLATGYFDVFLSPLVLESFYSGNLIMFIIVLVLMFQKSLSFPAIKRSVSISLVWSYYNLLYVWAVTRYGNPNQQTQFTIADQFVHGLQFLPFMYAFIKPPSRATKRVIREFCLAAIVLFLLSVLQIVLVTKKETAEIASRYVIYVLLTWVALCPLVVWRVLKADTEYWRGVGQRACALQDLFQRENGLSERVSSEGLHVLIEMNRKCVIDFAYLELVQPLGIGSTSTVYQGVLKTKTHVAVKAYAPESCSEDVVAAFSHEAAMCSALNHPNIVRFHGMCVAPPTICLVFQLCQGNLDNILEDQVRRQHVHPTRRQLLISVGYMLDAARAVAYLHSFSPPFVHRDIEPSNFLVDAECNVQLSDFGEARRVPIRKKIPLTPKTKVPVLEDKYFASNVGLESPTDTPTDTIASNLDSPWNRRLDKNSPEYAAPELLDGRASISHGEATDVYALGITMWDILHPGEEKYPRAHGSQAQVSEFVLQGIRPQFDNNALPRLRTIIERTWQRDPRQRPTAKQIVSVLEDVQEELSARLVLDLMGDLLDYPSEVSGSSTESTEDQERRTFPGAFIVDRMIDRRFVRCPAEAIRMGNALMDSGVLHHVNHSQRFENNAVSRYYFDLTEVQLCQPIQLEMSFHQSSSLSLDESNIPVLIHDSSVNNSRTCFSLTRTRNEAHCQCRLLGQRLISKTSSRLPRRKIRRAREPTTQSSILMAPLLVDEPSYLSDNNDLDVVPGTAAMMA
ncbi:TKL protein kinase [Phytophthora megakarya]|uniref:TKL protein kinase n=1 Tax=Phytophthora megakarya TaxID=4795 RepID=A0A225V371_9STRA|nr:TKL protein kinase [Phytophthora megakarya]